MNLYTEARSWKLLKIGSVSLTAVLSVLLWAAVPASATYPGANGKIAFNRFEEDGTPNLYTVNPDGSGERLVATGAAGASWSPDGKRIAFVRLEPSSSCCFQTHEVAVMNADGSGLRILADGGLPAWSPDGTKIAFAGTRPGGTEDTIAVMNADGSDVREVAPPGAFSSESRIGWSPDSRRVLFVGRNPAQGYTDDIYTVNADGTDETNLTNTPDDEIYPTWSPTSNKITFASAVPTGGSPRYDVYVMNPDGTGRTRLTNDLNNYDPTWSPDGTQVAYTHFATGSDSPPFVGAVRLGEAPRALSLGVEPVWSPDGTELAFTAAGIETIKSDGTGLTEVATGDGLRNYPPDWQPIPFKNDSKTCKTFPGDYRNHGQCVKGSR